MRKLRPMREELKAVARRSDRLRAAVDASRRTRDRLQATQAMIGYLRGQRSFADLPDPTAIRLAYNVLLDRDPDPVGLETFLQDLAGEKTKQDMVATIRSSDEFALSGAYRELGPSIHYGRGIFVRSLPQARRILDLGGSSSYHPAGAMVAFGYPYAFEELVIVELPADERHEHYQGVIEGDSIPTHLGPVSFRYHSMTDLGGIPDACFDLVYCGQSVEHVHEDEADKLLAEVHRVLRPRGTFAFDTPNGAVCRLQQDEFIDPDHKVEYTHAEISARVEQAGFRITRRHGLNHAGASVASGRFDVADTARHWGLFDDIERCYILAYVCTPSD